MATGDSHAEKQVRGDDLSERLLNFSVRVYKLVKAVPKDFAGRHVALQLFRSATSAPANYEEGRGAESDPDFVHKLGVAWKEMKESRLWLRFIHKAEMVRARRIESLLQESEELCRILGSSVRTAKKRLPPRG